MPNAIVATTTSTSSRAKRVLVARARLLVEPGVVRQRAHAVRGEECRERVDVLAAQRIDDAALAGAPAHVAEQILARAPAVALLVRPEPQIRPEE
jgi:phosphoserine phosphatase